MKLEDYVDNLTEGGVAVILPNEKHQQERIATNADGMGNVYEVVRYSSESLSQAKADERQLKVITSAVLNCPDVNTWWAYVRKVCPQDYVDDGVTAKVQDIYSTMLTTISIKLSEMLIVERHFSSAKTLLSILNTRMKTWQKECKVEATDGSKSVSIVFEGV